jgi:hypothetical protein
MPGKSKLLALPACIALLIAADQPWRDKKVPDWSVEDAKQVLDDSPWSRTVTPEMNRTNNAQRRGGMGRSGVSLGIPGIGGMGRRGGMGGGYPGGGYPGGGYPGARTTSGSSPQPPTLKLRWESALPIREAELKARETNAPTVDEGSYALAVYGIPARMLNGQNMSTSDLKKHAVLKRQGKKDLKASNVEILRRDDGPVVLYSFPRTNEITRNDDRVELQAQIGNLKIKQAFPLEDMIFQGRLEL